MHAKLLQLYLTLATPWIVAHQAPLSMGFCTQEYWSGLPCPPRGDLPHPRIKPSLSSPALAGRFFTMGATWEVQRSSQDLGQYFNLLPLWSHVIIND